MSGSTQDGPMMVVRRFIEAFNNGDVDIAQAACAVESSIIDDFPPHEWTGRGATARWFSDMARMSAEYGMSEPSVTLDEASQVMISDRHAYLVVPIDVRWLQDGERAERTGYMTMALREEAVGWRISVCAWTWN